MSFAGTNINLKGFSVEDSTKEYVSTFAGTNINLKGITFEDATKEFVSSFAGTNIEIDGASIESLNFNYFNIGDKDSIFYEVNNKGIHSKSGVLLETNPASNYQIKAITGLEANDKSTVSELVKLTIEKTECTGIFNSGITVDNIISGDLLANTAYILKVVGTTDLSGITDDVLTLNEPFVTKSSFVQPSWTGGTELEEILIIDNFQTEST